MLLRNLPEKAYFTADGDGYLYYLVEKRPDDCYCQRVAVQRNGVWLTFNSAACEVWLYTNEVQHMLLQVVAA